MVCLLLLLGVTVASARPPGDARRRAEARALLRQGNALFSGHDYHGALELYRRAYALVPSFKLDFNIGATLEAMGARAQAAEHYEVFLIQARREEKPKVVAEIETKLRALRAALARVAVISGRRGATVSIDGGAVGAVPLPRPVYLEPGRHSVTISERGRIRVLASKTPLREDRILFWQALTLAAGELRSVAATAPPPTVVAPAPPSALPPANPPARGSPIYRRWWFWTALGAVVVGAAVGGGYAASRAGDDRVPEGRAGVIR
jgi:hypothetical protein